MSDYETLLLEYFNHDSSQWSEDDLNIIVVTGWRWLAKVDVTSSSADDKNIRIVKMIQGALVTSLARNTDPCRFLSFLNELNPFQLSKTLDSAESGTYWFSPSYIPAFTGLLHAIEAYFKACLHNFGLSRGELHEALQAVHSKSYSSCSLNACPWISHSCKDAYKYPLVQRERRPLLVMEDVPAPSPSQSRGGLASSTDEEAAAPRSLLNRSKIFLRKHLRFTKPTDEESGESSRNTRDDSFEGDIAAGPSCRMSFSAMTSEEGAEGSEAGGIPLVSLDSGHSDAFFVDNQYVAAEAGLAGGDHHAPPSHSSAYITEIVDAIVSDVEPTHVDEASTGDDPTLIINFNTPHRLGSSERNIEHHGGGYSIGSSSPSAFLATCPPQPNSDVPSRSPYGGDTVAPFLAAIDTAGAQPEDGCNISSASATSCQSGVVYLEQVRIN